MPTDLPDFEIVERTFEERLRAWGLRPTPISKGVDSGLGRLELIREGCQVLEVGTEDGSGAGYFGSLEVKALLDHPTTGAAEVRDLITLRGDSPDGTLKRCAETFLDVTFPALRSLFEGAPAPGASSIKMSSFTPALGRAIRWEVFSGQLQILDDPGGLLAERLKRQAPLLLMFDALTGHLAEPRFHWCKLFGARFARTGLTFGCSIDGAKSEEAETEMLAKFRKGGDLPGSWEFRQFLALRPAGEADAAIAAQLRDKAAEELGPRRAKGWVSRLFGSR